MNSGLSFFTGGGETLVHICTKGRPDGAPTVFPVRSVERVEPDSADSQSSFLFLNSGFKVKVALAPAELQRRLFRPGVRDIIDGILDLRAATRAWAEVPAADRLKIGDSLPDGSVYLGISPATGKPFCAAPQFATPVDFRDAFNGAAALRACGCPDWRLLATEEAVFLHQHRDRESLQGLFNNADYLWTVKQVGGSTAQDYNFRSGALSSAGVHTASYAIYVRDISLDQFGG